MSKIILNNINKVYSNRVHAVNDFNLTIDDNELVVLVGPSGCGKTSVLRMIAGLESVTSGQLVIDDVISNNVLPQKRNISMIFQNYALYPHMTVFDNIAFNLKLSKMKKSEINKLVCDVSASLKIEHLLKRKPKELSGGEKQRVAMGRALVRNPKVFLMDEPLSNLDAKLRTELRKEIKRISKDINAPIIYVTHDQVEAMTLGTKIVVMKDGFIQQVGTPHELFFNPQNKFVAEFIGYPQMNFIEAMVIEKDTLQYLKISEDISLLVDKSIDGKNGNKITLGIRAEDIQIEPKILQKDNIFLATIDDVEVIGYENYINITLFGNRMIIKTSVSEFTKNEIYIHIDVNKIYIFNEEGIRIN